jgi:hypothetical protein
MIVSGTLALVDGVQTVMACSSSAMILSGDRWSLGQKGVCGHHLDRERITRMAVLDQASLAPREDLRPYAGKWVALRDGYVVASAENSVSLRDDAAVRESDQLLPVPATDSGMYVL